MENMVRGIELLDRLEDEVNANKSRSAWSKGVKVYALELIEGIRERAEYEGRAPEPGRELLEYALNGAESWKSYSWGGWSLIYNSDIAKRLCTPSELKRTRNGERRPNAMEEWLDTQARALYQAFCMVRNAYRRIY